VARIATKGLLGDKMIEITKGVANQSVPSGGAIPSEEPEDIFSKVTPMMSKAEATLDNLQRATDSLADEQLHKDLHEAVGSLNTVLGEVAHGDGYAHRLIADKQEADRISRTIAGVDQATRELSATLDDVHKIVARVEQGPGFTHDVIYGQGPQKQIEQFGNAAQELATTLKGVRESDSLAHDIVYGGKGNGAEAIANVTAITADLRTIVANVKAGKGTIGALLVDPSIYEDLKMVLGNVKRNDVLRALVRYSIKQDEKKPGVAVGSGH
jgi:phospholipid/cholesterol/gamma-HCH transport system substrate-binding protein